MTSTIYAIASAKEAIENKVGETAMLPANALQVLLDRIAELEDVLECSAASLSSSADSELIVRIYKVLRDE